MAGVAAAYTLAGWGGLLLAYSEGVIPLIWPAAGVAFASLLLFGRKLWPGLWVGSFIVSLTIRYANETPGIDQADLLGAIGIASGVAAQALFGTWLVERHWGRPVKLAKLKDVAVFIALAGPASCIVGATVAAVLQQTTGPMPIDMVAASWFRAWSADVAGILLILPIALFAPLGNARVMWRGRLVRPLNKSMTVGLGVLLGAALAAWGVTNEIAYDRNMAAFVAMADDSEAALNHRLETYRQSLDGGAAVVDAVDHLTRADWLNFIDIIELDKLPGINGIGFIEPVKPGHEDAFVSQGRADGLPQFAIHPKTAGSKSAGPRSTANDLLVIKYIEPIALNLPAIGLDIGFEENRRAAAESARDTGEARITKHVTLVQDEQKTPGFLMLRPVYRRGIRVDSVSARRAALRGWVVAPFIASRFIDNLTSSQRALFTITVYDGVQVNPAAQIFSARSHQRTAAFSKTRTIPVMGQNWTVVWESTAEFESRAKTNEPLLVLGAGLALTLCFGGLLLSYARREAVISDQVQAKTRDQRQAMTALYESERRFGDLAGLSPGGIIRSDPFGFCIYVNDSWLKLTGLAASNALGAGWIMAIHEADRDAGHRAWQQAIDDQVEHRATFRFVHQDGSSRWADMITRPELAETGVLLGFISVAMDVTERMKMESALQSARRQAEAAVEAKSSFLANMSHEIRTPMNGVIGFTELILNSELTAEQRRHAQLIADSGRSMMHLLNDILDLSKVEAGQMKITSDPVNLHQLITGSITLMTALADDKGIALSYEIAPDMPKIICSDGLRLRQVLLNLLGNALKFTSQGSVVLRAKLAPGAPPRMLLEVADTGIGIARDRQTDIFNQFVQADASIARDHGGTGLGLTISSKLAQLLGGELTVASELGQGSTFGVSLPVIVAEAAEAAGAATRATQLDQRRGPRLPRCCRILLVEDHDINQILMTDMLHCMGIDVEVADNGAIAVELVKASAQRRNGFDLVLMDINMPVMNGIDAAGAIRAAGIGASALPIVALTANAFDDDIARCLAAGMQAHLTKPVSMQNLEKAIELWAKRSSDHAARISAMAIPVQSRRSLDRRYQERKLDTIKSVETLALGANFDAAQLEAVAAKLHKLAGTAGMFDEAELGECARALECDLRAADTENLASRVERALKTMRAATMAA